jgi:hypothetical protein
VTDKDVLLAVIRALDGAGIQYMIVGSLSSNLYGIERSTQDADLVIDAAGVPISSLAGLLPDSLRLDPQVTFETITSTHRLLIRRKRGRFKVELFLAGDDPHDRERFARRVRVQAYGQSLWLPTPEDVIITKLRWSKQGKRTKDTEDVKNVIAVQGDALDWAYIHRWCDQHGTRELLERVRRSLPAG